MNRSQRSPFAERLEAVQPSSTFSERLPAATVQVRPFHVLTKPTGPICNLDCRYWFYLETQVLYPDVGKWKPLRASHFSTPLIATIDRHRCCATLTISLAQKIGRSRGTKIILYGASKSRLPRPEGCCRVIEKSSRSKLRIYRCQARIIPKKAIECVKWAFGSRRC